MLFLLTLIRKGGKGSGNWGHAGRPGKVGGSAKRGVHGEIIGNIVSPQGKLFPTSKYQINITHDEIDFARFFAGTDVSKYRRMVQSYIEHLENDVGGGDGKEERQLAMLMTTYGEGKTGAYDIQSLMSFFGVDSLGEFTELLGGENEIDITNFQSLKDLLWLSENSGLKGGDEVLELYRELEEGGDYSYGLGVSPVKHFVENVFSHDYSNGFSTRVTKIRSEYAGDYEQSVSIQGEITRHGEVVGTFRRSLVGDDYIEHVEHSYLELHRSAEGQGFGSEYYQHLENKYMDYGISYISLRADIDVGGYAWARMGYDFSDDYVARDFTRQFKSNFEYDFGYIPDTPEDASSDDVWHSWDIASYLSPDGESYGKDFMMGSDWTAYKYLNDGDGVEVGEVYYNAKSLEKMGK